MTLREKLMGGVVIALVAALATVMGTGLAQDVKRPRPIEKKDEKAAKEEAPEADKLYVWSVPEGGLQSVLVLRVIDGDTAECAFLVPFTARLKGTQAPELKEKGGKEAKEKLDELIGGKLLPARLHGREKCGRTLADFHLGKDGWAAAALIKAGHAKAYDPK